MAVNGDAELLGTKDTGLDSCCVLISSDDVSCLEPILLLVDSLHLCDLLLVLLHGLDQVLDLVR